MKIIYRPEIDGLRTIAVTAVILYHARITILGYQPFKGGFIGVDIFFVISGYLITSIILKELLITGTFSFKHFYERRLRRIFPALLLVMSVSIPFAWIYLLPSNFIDFSKSILYSLGFSSNFYFHYSGQQYGAESGLLKPFLHTWSLSVEEQYYIIFPIVLLFTFKYFRKYLIHILILGFIISLSLAELTSKNYSSTSFYFPHTRIWELLAGSIMAYFEITLGHRSKNQLLNIILPTIGLLLITFSIILFDNDIFHPSFYTLIPVTGVCLIIWFSGDNELVTKILSTKFFVGIGLISYSLYLWHYPIFAFARITNLFGDSIIKELLLGLIVIILSIVSYILVEKPARNKNNQFLIITGLTLISIFSLIIYNINVIHNKGYKNRVPEIFQENFTRETWNLLKNIKNENCFGNTQGCKFNTSSNKKVYLVGDSHMASIMNELKKKLVKNDYQFITFTISACLYFPNFTRIDLLTKKKDKKCNDSYFKKLKKILTNEENSILIFGGRLPIYLSNSYFDNKEGGIEGYKTEFEFISPIKFDSIQKSFKDEIQELAKRNKIILVYPIPEVGWDPKKKIYYQWIKEKFKKNFEIQNITTSYAVYKNRTKSSFKLLDSINTNMIYRVYPHKLFCNTSIKNRCVTHDNKHIFYADDDHPSTKGAELIVDLLIKKIQEIQD